MALAYARLTERMYADAVWKNVIVNAPSMFRATWKLVEPILDDETRELISFVREDELVGAGVPRRATPPDLGGSAAAVPLSRYLADPAVDDGFDAVACVEEPPEPAPTPAPPRPFWRWGAKLAVGLVVLVEVAWVVRRLRTSPPPVEAEPPPALAGEF